MLISTFKLNKNLLIILLILIIIFTSIIVFYSFANEEIKDKSSDTNNKFIKWVDFNVTAEALNQTAKLDIDSHNNNNGITYNWIELLAYLACKNGGNFKNFKSKDLNNLINKAYSSTNEE